MGLGKCTMSHSFSIDLDALEDAPDDDEAVAGLRISVGDTVLTRIRDVHDGRLRDFVVAPTFDCAFWFADNWWRLRYEPLPVSEYGSSEWRLRHELSSISGGIHWPPWMMYSTGDLIVCEPTITAGLGTRYALGNGSPAVVSATSFEAGVDAFFAAMRDRFARATDAKAFATLVDELAAERSVPGIAAWRRLEARLGFDPGAAPAALMERLAEYEGELGEETVAEAAVAAPGAHAAEVLTKVIESANNGIAIKRDAASPVDEDVSFATAAPNAKRSGPYVWMEAERAAARVRAMVNMPHGPILGKAFGDILNIRWESARLAPQGPREYGGVIGDAVAGRISFRSRPHAAPRRFELARALGDAVLHNSAPFAPVTRAKTERQAFQRAFAQSFLSPYEDVRAYIDTEQPDEAAIAAAATHFHVSDLVIRSLLWNKGLLRRDRTMVSMEMREPFFDVSGTSLALAPA